MGLSRRHEQLNDHVPRCLAPLFALPDPSARAAQVDWDAQGEYSTTIFTSEAVDVINAHDPTTPLFLYLAYQVSTGRKRPGASHNMYARLTTGAMKCPR